MHASEPLGAANAVAVLVHTLLPEACGLRLQDVAISLERVTLTVASTHPEAACPLCTHPSQRVQSRYSRTLADLPWAQRPVQLQLQVRRFVCANPDCPRKVFAERLPELVLPYARRTTRLQQQQVAIGFAVGGEGGARICRNLGLTISSDTLLVGLRRQALPVAPTPRVLGVDDWSFRRGRQMGTILVDLERRLAVDLLPDCSEDSFAAWLEAHPGVETISRDRR